VKGADGMKNQERIKILRDVWDKWTSADGRDTFHQWLKGQLGCPRCGGETGSVDALCSGCAVQWADITATILPAFLENKAIYGRCCTRMGTWRVDPYRQELYDEENYEFLCDECCQKRCDDT